LSSSWRNAYSNSNLHLTLGDSRYYSFAVYIHPQSDDVLGHGFIFTQAWQRHLTQSSGGISHQPAFDLRFLDGSDYKWAAEISNDQTGPNNPAVVYTSSTGLSKGVWHEFIIRIRPSAIGQGAVQVWIDGQLAFSISESSGQDIGYTPCSKSCSKGVVLNDFAVRFGAYHKPEPDNPTHAILLFDQAKFGLSYASVDP
jgi:polysaccharide lyase-like protein